MSFFILSTIFPWTLIIALMLLITIIIIFAPEIIRVFFKMPTFFKVSLLVVILLGFFLRFSYAPNFHRIYYDEDRYLSYAVTFAKFNQAVSINLATPDKLIQGVPDDAGRTTVPVINALILKFFGYSEENLFQTAKVFSTIQILLIFVLAYLLFKNYTTALFSALGMAVIPTNIYWSSSINLDTYAVFFALLSLIGATLYAKAPSLKTSLMLILSFILLLGVRIESFVLLPVIMFCIYAVRYDNKLKLLSKKELPYIAIFISCIALRGLLSASVIGQKWCCAEALPLEVFAMNYLIRNLLPNIGNLFLRPEFPFIISLFAISVLIYKSGKTKFILGLWIIIYFLLYSTYYAGNFFTYEFSGSYGRYFLMLIPGLLILASVGITDLLKNFKKKKVISTCTIIIFLVSLFPTALRYQTFISQSPYFALVEEGPKTLHDFLEFTIIPNTPKESVIIHSLTAPLLLAGKSTVYIGHFFEKEEVQDYVYEQVKNGKNVYIFESYTCSIFPRRCQRILEKFTFTPLNLEEGKGLGLDINKVTLKNATSSAR